ncbi:PAS domain S-box protein [Nodosilinea sp. LEGE 07298]|uniref:PAS domain S-box protein n=1 Tax=Nodosilinea sp. LEGE 07298 TaxID=2777970 RepID=UPI0018826C97|nr:PAS domain S-box protein [Nodosilinea sp. LEGE 07298]MBE9112550.1 PAS domain S-box protein [Nodosilinea sp. LEGE 07298]
MAGTSKGVAIDWDDGNGYVLPSPFRWEHLVATIALRIRQSLDLEAILPVAVEAVQQLLHCDRVLIYQFDPDWSGQVVVEALSDPQWSVLDQVVRDSCFEPGWLKPYHEGLVRAIADVATADLTPCHAEFLVGLSVKANLVVPVLCEAKLWGLLIAHSCTAPRSWPSEEMNGLQQIAVHIGIAIHQAELVAQLQAAKANLEAQVAARTQDLEQSNQHLAAESQAMMATLSQSNDERLQLAAIVDSSGEAIISQTLDGIITSWNRSAERLFGYTAAEVVGQPVAVLIPPDRQIEAQAVLQRILRGDRVETYETQRLHKDSCLVDVALTISPICDQTGSVIGLSKIARDIGEQKAAQRDRDRFEAERNQALQELHQSNAQLEDFFDNATDLIQSVSLQNGQFLYVNRAWLTILGYTRDELAGLTIFDLLAPDYLLQCQSIFQSLQAGDIHQVERLEIAVVDKMGQRVLLEGSINVRREAGIPVATRAILRDVTAQRQVKQALQEQTTRLRIFYDTSPLLLGLVETSENDILHLSDNPAALSFFGLTAEALTNRWASEVGVPAEVIQRWLTHYRQSQQLQRPVQFDYTHITPTNRYYLLVTVSLVGQGNSGRPQFSYIVQDLTEKKQLEREKDQAITRLHDSEQRYASLVAAVPVGIFRTDANGLCIYTNQRWEQLAGLTQQEARGEGWSRALYAEDRDLVFSAWNQAAQQGRPFELEYRFQSTDGTVSWVYGQAVAEYSATGDRLGYVGTITDITERRQIEAERQRARQAQQELSLLEQILDIVLAGYWDWHIPADVEYYSPGFKQMLGYADHELPNSPQTWQDLILPEDLAGTMACLDRHIQSHGESPYYSEVRYRHKDGSMVWVACSGQVIEWAADGSPIRMIGCHINITDRKQTELALRDSEATNRAFIAAIPDLLMRMHQDGSHVQIVNPGTGYVLQLKATLAGCQLTELIPQAIAQERIHLAQQALKTGQIQQQEYAFTAVGQTFYEEARIAPIGGDEVLVVVRDISDRKRGEAERKQAELDLKSANDQLKLVLQASSEGFWDWNLITGDIYFSPQWKAMLGYADHELENNFDMWAALIFEADRTTALQLVEDYNSGRIDNFTANQRFRHKDGSVVHVLSRAIHLKDEQGSVVRMVGSHLDMTQMVTIQTALKTSEMQLSGILNSSLDGIMAFRSVRDSQSTIVDFEWLLSNPTACQIIGRQADDIIGKRMLEELPGNREDGLFDLYVQVVKSGEPMQRQFYYNHDGIDCWFENSAVKLGDGFAVIFRDISAIKQSEITLQQTNQQLSNRIGELDQRHSEMLVLSEISDFLQACSTVNEACYAIVNLIEPLFPHCSGGIFTTSASRNRLECAAAWGKHLHSKAEFEPHSCWGLRRGRMHWVGQDRLSLRCSHTSAPEALTIATTLCIPMIAQGETLGLFYLSTDVPEALPEAKQQLARTLAEQVGMAIANLKLQETLKHQSIRDPLTGLYNRRYLEESLSQEIVRSQRKQLYIGVIMIDIDHFRLSWNEYAEVAVTIRYGYGASTDRALGFTRY